MIAVDTNVLVRLLTRDDEKQAERARKLFDQHAGKDGMLFVSDVVLAELAWTLDRGYRFERADIARAIRSLADNATITLESSDSVRVALGLHEKGGTTFPDCLIAAKAAAAKCKSLATFDKGMKNLPLATLL